MSIRSKGILIVVLIAAAATFSCGKKEGETAGTAPAAARRPAPPPLPAGTTQDLKKNTGDPNYVFDSLGPVSYPAVQKNIQISGDASNMINGWALDPSKKSVAGGVDIVIDQVPHSARYGIERSDVSIHFKRPDYINCGYLLTLEPGQLAKGQHTVSVRVITNDKKSYNEGPTVQFTVN